MNQNNFAFLCLGVMGAPMARHLAEKGDGRVTVYNRSIDKARAWVTASPGQVATSPCAAAAGADMIFLCAGNDEDVRQILTGEAGVIHEVAEGAIIVDHTTTSAKLARDMHLLFSGRGVGYLDAPVSGGQAGAEKGQLTVMAGGDNSHFLLAEPIIRRCYAKEMKLMGSSGAGQIAKMVNQICIAGLLQGLSEGLAFGRRAGLDLNVLLDVISKGAAQSWQMDNRGITMAAGRFDFGFAVDWMVKDLQIALEEGAEIGTPLETTRQVLSFYRELQEMGKGRWDTSALIARLEAE